MQMIPPKKTMQSQGRVSSKGCWYGSKYLRCWIGSALPSGHLGNKVTHTIPLYFNNVSGNISIFHKVAGGSSQAQFKFLCSSSQPACEFKSRTFFTVRRQCWPLYHRYTTPWAWRNILFCNANTFLLLNTYFCFIQLSAWENQWKFLDTTQGLFVLLLHGFVTGLYRYLALTKVFSEILESKKLILIKMGPMGRQDWPGGRRCFCVI